MPLQRIDPSTFTEQTWANGAGRTLELARDIQADRWRLSVARIETDADFSPLPGIDRQFTPLDQPVHLHFGDDRPLHVHRLQVVRFDGGAPPRCTLPEGSSRAFNFMLRADAATDAKLIARPLLGTMLIVPEPGSRWFVYVASGQARLSQNGSRLALESGDAAWIDHAPAARTLIEGASDLLLVRLPAG